MAIESFIGGRALPRGEMPLTDAIQAQLEVFPCFVVPPDTRTGLVLLYRTGHERKRQRLDVVAFQTPLLCIPEMNETTGTRTFLRAGLTSQHHLTETGKQNNATTKAHQLGGVPDDLDELFHKEEVLRRRKEEQMYHLGDAQFHSRQAQIEAMHLAQRTITRNETIFDGKTQLVRGIDVPVRCVEAMVLELPVDRVVRIPHRV